jgi:ribosomal protein S18 acetylase RimI-like enzyme
MEHPLENPIWHALATRHAALNMGSEQVRFFHEDVSPFVAMDKWNDDDMKAMSQQVPGDRTFYVLIPRTVSIPDVFEQVYTTPIYQMVCQDFKPQQLREQEVLDMGNRDVQEMIALTALTRPGPFGPGTMKFGKYIGIRREGRLAAIAGERMKVPGFTEVSAVCTHPDFLGNGYASHLMGLLCRDIIDRNETPFLHVRADNDRAIKTYERMGFAISRDVFFAIIKRKSLETDESAAI